MKKVLIITYYWPPSGGAGVQRWLKFAKYLREFGWEPVVYTPSNPENPVEDSSLFKDIPANLEVIKTPIWEPYGFYKKFVGRKKEEKINTGFLSEKKKTGFTEKVSVWLRGNFFIPDARKFWIKPSINFLSKYLTENKIDFIVSTGPPHSMHLIALGLKKKFNIPWLADFRDPWTNIDYYKDLMLSKSADKKHHQLEREVLANADLVVSIGNTMNEEFVRSQLQVDSAQLKKFHVITNGYDEEDLINNGVALDKKFSIAHIGTLVRSRNPEALWKSLSDLITSNSNFESDLEIRLVGKVDASVMELIEKY
ncbi:MAG TPA: glycosyl transferase family 1, partial [Bacteroidia bacterium]|nr:glycosyl transferase family 1 [Bacteroidia bacterium]